MAFVTDKTVFIHVQKTGGMTVRHALYHCRPTGHESGNSEAERHLGLPELQASHPGVTGGRTVFGFVRNPVEWIASRWAYGVKSGFDVQRRHRGSAAALWMSSCWSNNFETFVERYLERYPGVATQTMFRMLGLWSDTPATMVGRCESLVPDLLNILDAAGEVFDRQAIERLPHVNSAKKRSGLAGPLRSRILQAEHLLVERYYSDA